MPLLLEKFERALRGRLPARQGDAILGLCADAEKLSATPIHRWMELFIAC